MFLRRKKHAWYWGVIVLFFALRVIFRFARFFMKIAEKQAARSEMRDRSGRPRSRRKV
jgi:hypothetical protein